MNFKGKSVAATAAGAAVVIGVGLAGTTTAAAASNCGYQYKQLLVTFYDQTTACVDVNAAVAQTERNDLNGTTYFGEYQTSQGWALGSGGYKYMSDGVQSPWKVFITDTSVNTALRMRGYNGASVGTYT